MNVIIREMTERPEWASHDPVKAPFGGHYSGTIQKLEAELALLDIGITEVVIEITGPKIEIRRDGWMSARSVLDPPVIISFESEKHGHLQYRSGRYQTWHSNVHAVALTLERLRAIDRYGCAGSGEQYTGWAALPAGMGRREAEDLIRSSAGVQSRSSQVTTSVYRRALRSSHPDGGGTAEEVQAVIEAGRILGLTD